MVIGVMAIGCVRRQLTSNFQWATGTACSRTARTTPLRTACWLGRRTPVGKMAGLSLTWPRVITCGSSQERDVWSVAVDQQRIRLGVSGIAQGLGIWTRIGGWSCGLGLLASNVQHRHLMGRVRSTVLNSNEGFNLITLGPFTLV